jgi:CTP-dependent riboflavin kinase
MDQPRTLNGIVFSDLGQASSFMKLDWVMSALNESLGFPPYPATLNLRPKAEEDAATWEIIQRENKSVRLASGERGFCAARLFLVAIEKPAGATRQRSRGAVVLPQVSGYPKDKIEVVSPVRLKDELRLRDGDQLILEFIP